MSTSFNKEKPAMIAYILVLVFTFNTAPMMTVKTILYPDQAMCEKQGQYLAANASTMIAPNSGQHLGTALYTCQEAGKDEMTPLRLP